jgi:SsrA-binding protein
MPPKTRKETPRIRNRRARFRYELLDKLECGIVLTGTEVRSLRTGQGSLEEAFARVQDGEIWLCGFHIPPYEHGNVHNHDPLRRRKLLLHKSEISKLEPKLKLRGLTLVPVELYFNNRGVAKVTVALARGKAQHDKREDIRKREAEREMDRATRRR